MNPTRLAVIFLGLVLALPLRAKDVSIYPSAEAKKHVGEYASVVGKVCEVHETSSGNLFINFGPPYPDSDFTLVIFAADRAKFGDLSALNGKTVTVTGTIKDYKDKPEIVADQPAQIKAKSD